MTAGPLRAGMIVNRFDQASEVGQWRLDFGSAAVTQTWDPSENADAGAGYGSLKLTVSFDAALGANNQFALTREYAFPATNLSQFSRIQMDVKIATNSPIFAGGNGASGYFQIAIRNTDNYNWVSQFGGNLYSSNGWFHIDAPLTAPVDAVRAFSLALWGGAPQNLTGTATIWMDNLVVSEAQLPPQIVTQPQSMAAGVGASADFEVTASGTPPLSYQWRKGGVSVTDATETSYSAINLQPSDAGNFDVVVSNSFGSVTSAVAVLTVDLSPHITSQPQSITVARGSNATFQVTAAGLPPLTYQWRKDRQPLSGATATFYTVADVQPATAGVYDVVVTNSSGSVTSAPAVLSFIVPPPVLASLQSATADTPPFSNSSAASAIDGTTSGNVGWAGSSNGAPAMLVFQTETNVGFSNGTFLTFTLYQGTSSSSNRNFQLGCFRLSATTDDRSTYADGRYVGGRVVANWTALEPFTYTAANQAMLTKQFDLSLLASGGTNTIDTTYTITAFTALTGITGFRLEALTNASLPNHGPGRSTTGAFQLQEIQVGAQPAWINPYPQVQVTWGLTLANPVQSAAPGDTLVFSGTLKNAQGIPLAVRSVGLYFETIPATTNAQLDFDSGFLPTASAIPSSGYAGPFFRATLPADLPAGFFAGGALEVMLEPQQAFGEVTPADEHPLVIQVPFTINGPPLTLQRTAGGLTLSWPAAAQDFKLQSATDLILPNAWEPFTPTLFREYDRLTTTLPAEGQRRFFRLRLP